MLRELKFQELFRKRAIIHARLHVAAQRAKHEQDLEQMANVARAISFGRVAFVAGGEPEEYVPPPPVDPTKLN